MSQWIDIVYSSLSHQAIDKATSVRRFVGNLVSNTWCWQWRWIISHLINVHSFRCIQYDKYNQIAASNIFWMQSFCISFHKPKVVLNLHIVYIGNTVDHLLTCNLDVMPFDVDKYAGRTALADETPNTLQPIKQSKHRWRTGSGGQSKVKKQRSVHYSSERRETHQKQNSRLLYQYLCCRVRGSDKSRAFRFTFGAGGSAKRTMGTI